MSMSYCCCCLCFSSSFLDEEIFISSAVQSRSSDDVAKVAEPPAYHLQQENPAPVSTTHYTLCIYQKMLTNTFDFHLYGCVFKRFSATASTQRYHNLCDALPKRVCRSESALIIAMRGSTTGFSLIKSGGIVRGISGVPFNVALQISFLYIP